MYIKTALQIAKNRIPKDMKAKERARAEKAPFFSSFFKKWIPALQTAQKTTPQEKSWVEDGSGKQRAEVTLRREKGALLNSKRSKTTKKNSWIDKDLRKSPKRKCFEENGTV